MSSRHGRVKFLFDGGLRFRAGIVSLGRRVTVFPGRHNFLKGPDSVIGRSLVLYNVTTDRPITCSLIVRRHVGTVEPVREISLGAKLLAPIAGTVTFTQGINDQTGESYETQIIASVFANDLSVPEGQYTWQLVKRQVSDTHRPCLGSVLVLCDRFVITKNVGRLQRPSVVSTAVETPRVTVISPI